MYLDRMIDYVDHGFTSLASGIGSGLKTLVVRKAKKKQAKEIEYKKIY